MLAGNCFICMAAALGLALTNFRRNAQCRLAGGHIPQDHGIGANAGVIANPYFTKNLGSSADVDMATDMGRTAFPSGTNCHLLKDKAVRANSCFGMNHHPIGMWQQQSTADIAVEWNIGACDNAPKAMANNRRCPYEASP